MNQDQLIKGCIQQNSKAQEELYNRYKANLFGLSLKYCSNETEAEDNLHNAFIEIFTNIKNFNAKGTFEGWIKRITINKAIDSYKRTYKITALENDYYEEIIVEDMEIDLSLDFLLSIIQELPNQYRIVFNLYELDDYSHQEIAQMLSISEGTSKSNLHRAKLLLKEKITSKINSINNLSNGK
ncbi:MAG TPA: RNA polymerase sigma factor [Flavobacterium alvei]|nr:RNA polymerase sigma factor [Flavobacterium alvei]